MPKMDPNLFLPETLCFLRFGKQSTKRVRLGVTFVFWEQITDLFMFHQEVPKLCKVIFWVVLILFDIYGLFVGSVVAKCKWVGGVLKRCHKCCALLRIF